ncbi:hypothetical protein RB614_09085 [Phytohabitans sp. ZYX-F-186]|uniref:Cas12f1-like TNB domain-containing protein n=1 Tax=Phytohabitans maris TaxID=3071409 RepID=A0ABU0ZCG4_9ACTN|nr:hypothetical protein [Phytohabitans sp. ZYX-F-186]MDQ7904673.1 hypothetical protein [Phytohabitans sp. ZYX-F-186]
MGTVVYRYGLRGHVELPEVLWEQIRMAHRFGNALVELEEELERARNGVWASDPGWAHADREVTAADDRLQQVVARAKRERFQDQHTAAEAAQAVRAARAGLAAARAVRKRAAGAAYPGLAPRFAQLKAEHVEAVKACRRSFAARGLYWATYNTVEKRHHVAVRLVARRRSSGQPARLHRHRLDGGGLVAVQLKRAAGDPTRTPAVLASGAGKWRNVMRLTPWMEPAAFDGLPRGERRAVGRTGQVSIAVGGSAMVTLPVVVHRMMPADADVCAAELVVRRLAGTTRAALCVTVKVPDPPAAPPRPPVAVHLGWRGRADGSVRVAVWASPHPLPPPPQHLAEVVVVHDGGRWGELVVPARTVDVAARPAALRSTRDQAFDPVRDKLAGWLDSHPQPDPTDDDAVLTGEQVRRWRSTARLAALAIGWRTTPPAGGGEMAALLEAWRVRDKHLWTWEANERHQTSGRRDEMWRRAAAWLTAHTAVLVLDDTDLKTLRRSDTIDDPMLPGIAAAKARARAQLVAPGRLRHALTTAARRRGVAVHTVSRAGLTRTHRACGHTAPAHPRYAAAAVVTCPHCHLPYDQDHNAAWIMLDRHHQLPQPAAAQEHQ